MGDERRHPLDLDHGKDQPVDWIEAEIDEVPDPIPDREGTQERHDQVGTGLDAIDAQGLTGILVRRLEAELILSHVEEPAKTDRAVNQKAFHLKTRAFELSLEQIVEEARDEPNIMKEVADPALHDVGHDEVVAFRNRLQD